ncbi:Myc-type, basic helix-loop-helix (bHLH) domain containing protein [Parasponia andersonii]|uniref:Myc-type, basic helix-loop-helix (BHLH) domain containing protein n=1 Tax=Parasponia andersonii TaxID=3476 RepID=A0A2P5CJ54_PARAD|nr:Myc-type, basic helix-loop-helix (bHLH) domain containing protein [Parasponia andersonii]
MPSSHLITVDLESQKIMGYVSPCIKTGYSYKNDEMSENCELVSLKRSEKRRRRKTRRVRLSGRFHRLQRLVPGGQGLQPDRLMAQTAGYIMHLRLQLSVLDALLKVHDHT